MFQGTYLEAVCTGSSVFCSAEELGSDLLSDSLGRHKEPHSEFWGGPSESPSLGFFGAFRGRTPPPDLERKEDERMGDAGSVHCHG